MDNDAKLRPWILAKILYERTDYDCSLSTAQLVKILEEEYDLPTHRTTIGPDIEMLQSLGMDIQLIKTNQNRYNVLDRYFNDAELRLMIDAVASSRFISAKQSESIAQKIAALAGRNAAEKMVRTVSVERRIKGSNQKVLGVIEAINLAINEKKQISFQYFEYDINKRRKLRFDRYKYHLSPYRLVWNGDYYYVVGYYEKHKQIVSYRVDRIACVPLLLEDKAIPMPKGFDLDRHLNTMYHMFSTERRAVELICSGEVMGAIVDRFGEKVKTRKIGNDHFIAVVETAVNTLLYSWVFGFGGLVKIKSPLDVKQAYEGMVAKAYNSIDKTEDRTDL